MRFSNDGSAAMHSHLAASLHLGTSRKSVSDTIMNPKHFTLDTTFASALFKMPLLTAGALKLATSRGHLHSDLDDVKFPSTEDNIKKLLKSLASKGPCSI
ncbi:hypothetical protein IV203_037200 [Nitzschia inconspicua]|uniref:Uncharacterized protein n=1 Tax=Nitzschia inconspicua TaxID=303405 RepID=A0A9K3LKP2_9STRA|nr:hypothetical protein IV203_037200 [Nitzschia inconspicua]